MSQPVVRGDDVARALAQLLHRGAGAGRVVLDALAELLQVRPGLVPALDRVLRVLVAEDVGQAHQEGAAGPRIGGARVHEAVGVGLAPGEQRLCGRRRLLHLLGHVFEQRSRRVVGDGDPLVLGELLHLRRARQVLSFEVGELVGVFRQQVDPQPLLDAGGQPVGAGEHEVDVDAAGVLLRLDLAGELGRRRLGEGDPADRLRMIGAVFLDRLLGQCEVAGDVDDVDRLWRRRQCRRLSPGRDGEGERREEHAALSIVVTERLPGILFRSSGHWPNRGAGKFLSRQELTLPIFAEGPLSRIRQMALPFPSI